MSVKTYLRSIDAYSAGTCASLKQARRLYDEAVRCKYAFKVELVGQTVSFDFRYHDIAGGHRDDVETWQNRLEKRAAVDATWNPVSVYRHDVKPRPYEQIKLAIRRQEARQIANGQPVRHVIEAAPGYRHIAEAVRERLEADGFLNVVID